VLAEPLAVVGAQEALVAGRIEPAMVLVAPAEARSRRAGEVAEEAMARVLEEVAARSRARAPAQ